LISKIKSRIFDVTWLFALGLAPVFAGGSLILLMLLTLLGVAMRLQGNTEKASAPVQTVALVFVLYFVYFYLSGAVLGRDLWAPYSAMKGNIVLLIVAFYGLLGAGWFHRLSSHQIGVWSSVAVFLTAIAAASMYLGFYYFPAAMAPMEGVVWADTEKRLEMFSRNPLMFASMLTTVSFLSLLGFDDKTKRERMLALAAVPVGVFVVLVAAQARGVLMLCAPLLLLTIWYLRISFAKALMFILAGLIFMFTAIVFIEPFAAIVDPVLGRITAGWVMLTTGGQVPEYSLVHRIRMFQLGWAAIMDSPWWGYGYQNRFAAIIPYMQAGDDFNYGHLHNAMFNHWVAGGVPGLAMLMMVLGLPLFLVRRFSQQQRDVRFLALLITTMMVGTGLYTAILGHFVHTTFYGMMILTLALLLDSRHVKHKGQRQ